MSTQKRLEFLVYPGFTALDLVGPHHMLSGLPDVQQVLVSIDGAPVTSDTGLTVVPDAKASDMDGPAFGIFAPGGTVGTLAAMQDKAVIGYLARRAPDCDYVMSVCTGSLILAAAGLLDGYKATSHWLTVDVLARFGAIPTHQRVVRDRNCVTGAGVTAGMDFGLSMIRDLMGAGFASAVQLIAEYDPLPPLRSGHPDVAANSTMDQVRSYTAGFMSALESAFPAK